MSKFFSNKMLFGTAVLMSMGLTGCNDYDPVIPVRSYEELGLPSFATTRGLNIELDLGKYGGSTAVQVYSENPYDSEGNFRGGLKPVFAFFTKDGKYNENVELASVYDELYFACQGIGVPQLLRGEVRNGRVVFDGVGTRAVSTVAIGNDDVQGMLTLDKYEVISTLNAESRFGEFAISGSDDYSQAFESNLYALYPWSISGKPLVKGGDDYTHVEGEAPAVDSYDNQFYYEWKNDAPKVLNTNNWLTVENNTDYVHRDTKTVSKDVEVDDLENPLESYFALTVSSTYDNYFGIKIPKRGDGILCVERLKTDGSEHKFATAWNDASFSKPNTCAFLGSAISETTGLKTTLTAESKISCNADGDVFKIALRQGPFYLTKISYTELGTDGKKNVKYELSLAKDGTPVAMKYDFDADENEGEGSVIEVSSVFSTIPNCIETTYGKKTEPQDVEVPDYSKCTTSGKSSLGINLPMQTKPDGTTTVKTNLYFTVPANTFADLTMCFADTDYAAFYLYKKNSKGEYKDTLTFHHNSGNPKFDSTKGKRVVSSLPAGEYKIMPTCTNHLYFARLKCVAAVKYDTYSSSVYAYNNVYDANMQNLMESLKDDLWSGYGSKTARKVHFQDIKAGKISPVDGVDFLGSEELKETTYNKRYSTLQTGAKNNITVQADGTEIWVTFLDEYNMYSCNTFGYYYYNEADYQAAPDKQAFAAGLEKFIVFPNCSAANYNTRSGGKYMVNKQIMTGIVPLETGDKVQLLYHSGETKAGLPAGYTTEFPADVKVGWFIIYNAFNGWDDKNDAMCDGKINMGATTINNNPNRLDNLDDYYTRVYYSDQDFNATGNGVIQRCVQISEPGGIAICFEDSYDATNGYDDMTYDDLIFAVTASAPVTNNSGVTGGGDTPKPITFNEYGTYLFEDILDATATDFDLNDVVVEYSRDYTLEKAAEGQGVLLTKVVETYKIVNDGATYNDAFIVKTPFKTENVAGIKYTVTNAAGTKVVDNQSMTLSYNKFVQKTGLSGRAVSEPRLESDGGNLEIVLIDNINYAELGSTYTFEITLTSGGLAAGESTDGLSWDKPANYQSSNYDPYVVIIDGVDLGGERRNEMHTPGKPTTSYGQTMSGMNAAVNSNYWSVANVGGKYLPFALDIAGKLDFALCEEYTLISDVYSKFTAWAENNATNRDWYNAPGTGTTTARPTQPDAVVQ